MLRRSILLLAICTVIGACSWGTGGAEPEEARSTTTTSPFATWHVHEGASGDCTGDDPCGTIETALAKADAGDVIELGPGDHGDLLIKPSTRAPDGTVTIRSAPSSRATLSSIEVHRPDLAFEDITVTGPVFVRAGADGTTMSGIHVDGGSIYISASSVRVAGSRIEPSIDNDGIQIKVHPPGSSVPHDVIIEGNTIGPIVASPDTTHIDGIQLLGTSNTTITRNTIFSCASQCIIGGEGNSDLLIERNVIELAPDNGGYNAINLQNIPNMRMIHNTIVNGRVVLSSDDEGLEVRGNAIKALDTCGAFLTGNVVERSNCALPPGNVNAPLHLVGSGSERDPATPPDAAPARNSALLDLRDELPDAPADLGGVRPCPQGPTVGAIEVCS